MIQGATVERPCDGYEAEALVPRALSHLSEVDPLGADDLRRRYADYICASDRRMTPALRDEGALLLFEAMRLLGDRANILSLDDL